MWLGYEETKKKMRKKEYWIQSKLFELKSNKPYLSQRSLKWLGSIPRLNCFRIKFEFQLIDLELGIIQT